jgi:hypothetical protein
MGRNEASSNLKVNLTYTELHLVILLGFDKLTCKGTRDDRGQVKGSSDDLIYSNGSKISGFVLLAQT